MSRGNQEYTDYRLYRAYLPEMDGSCWLYSLKFRANYRPIHADLL